MRNITTYKGCLALLCMLSASTLLFSQQQIKPYKTHTISTADTEFEGSTLLIDFQLSESLSNISGSAASFDPTYIIEKVTVTDDEGKELSATEFDNRPSVLDAGGSYQLVWDLERQGVLELYGVQKVEIEIGYSEQTKREISNHNDEVYRKNRRQGTFSSLFGFNRDYSQFSIFGGWQTGYLIPDISADEGYSMSVTDTDASNAWYFGGRLYFTNYFSVQASAHFTKASFQYDYHSSGPSAVVTQQLKYETVQIPLVANIHVGPKFTLFGGLYFSKIKKGSIEEEGKTALDLFDENLNVDGESPLVSSDKGYLGGVEYKMSNIAIGAKYERGLQNLFNENYNSLEIPTKEDGRQLYHGMASVYITWFLF
ncbi:hypothetical protein R9C00_09785 [Flammeovirgaceae bacterium SG7u.111]|nr:hypothetical protein [Flammeovirgaceae bacterium SG7u.132]WPO37741.1 hypothetical protein R9C00_09785 [Flammeovirgaceae bacterium SG7u.111]